MYRIELDLSDLFANLVCNFCRRSDGTDLGVHQPVAHRDFGWLRHAHRFQTGATHGELLMYRSGVACLSVVTDPVVNCVFNN